MNFMDNRESNLSVWARLLIAGTVFCLIFDNIPRFIQIGLISSGFSCKFSWYFLFILMIVWIYQTCKGNFIISKDDYLFVKYIFCLMVVVLLSNILGLINYPYYNELLLGPSNQIEKLPTILSLLDNHGIAINEKYLTIIWIGIRSVKGAILNVLYTFGFSFVLYQFFKRDWEFCFNLITTMVIASITILCIYSIIELFYLAGFNFAQNILSAINPIIHPIAVDHGWWPPLLWKGQLRSLFSEPSRMGNYLAFAMPFLWGKFLLSDKKSIGVTAIIIFYTFMIFMTKARTAVALYFGIMGLLFLGVVYIHKKNLIKKFFIICGITVLSLGMSIGFINMTTQNDMGTQETTMTSYMDDNVLSLESTNKRSNGARYALICANAKTGIEHPILGVGGVLTSAYTVHNFNEADLANKEVSMWVKNFQEQGTLRYSLDSMNEYVSLFANYGSVGLVLFLVPAMYALFGLFKRIRLAQGDEVIKIYTILLSLIGTLVAGCNGSLTLLYTYWVVLAFAYAILFEGKKSISR